MKKGFSITVFSVGIALLIFFCGLFFGRCSVPTIPAAPHGTQEASTHMGENSSLININTADVYQLQQLPGIGEVLAQRIVDYRTQHGPFPSINHLQQVEGIGIQTLENILQYICLED